MGCAYGPTPYGKGLTATALTLRQPSQRRPRPKAWDRGHLFHDQQDKRWPGGSYLLPYDAYLHFFFKDPFQPNKWNYRLNNFLLCLRDRCGDHLASYALSILAFNMSLSGRHRLYDYILVLNLICPSPQNLGVFNYETMDSMHFRFSLCVFFYTGINLLH
jgi:hypothetical protein